MSRLDIYRTAMLVANAQVSRDELLGVLSSQKADFARFVIDHGLGPLWYERTGRKEFHESRMQAEALFAVQEDTLGDIDAALTGAGIEYAVIKGAADRSLLYDNPAVRACYDIDLLVRRNDRVAATAALVDEGFAAFPNPVSISFELLLTRGNVDVDLHWRLLRDGRLRYENIDKMLKRRRREKGHWMLDSDDATFLLLVHSAFKKHLASWEMGLHRVADILRWFQTQTYDWNRVLARIEKNSARTAAWATLCWVQLLTRRSGIQPRFEAGLDELMLELQPGPLRRAWLDRWLRYDLSERSSGFHKARLLAFSLALHDDLQGVVRALAGRYSAHRRRKIDLEAFRHLVQ